MMAPRALSDAQPYSVAEEMLLLLDSSVPIGCRHRFAVA